MSFNITIGSFFIATALLLTGCDSIIYNTPTEVSTDRIEISREDVALEFDTASLSPAALEKLSHDYRARGDSAMLVTVTYDPHSSANTARRASDTAAGFATALSRQGVKALEVETLPVLDSGDRSSTLVSYAGLKALPPSSCGDVLDMDMVSDLDRTENYALGCSVKTFTARQVAKPADLLGKDTMDTVQGRYSVNSLEPYMSGAQNKDLGGENASD